MAIIDDRITDGGFLINMYINSDKATRAVKLVIVEQNIGLALRCQNQHFFWSSWSGRFDSYR